jgi:folate-binding protein YgfZ
MREQARVIAERARKTGVAVSWTAAPRLGAILATGPEVASFLQAQLTSNVQEVVPGQGQLSARLDRRGNLVSWFHLLCLPDRGQPFPSFLMVLPAGQVPLLMADLSDCIFRENVLLEDFSAEFEGVVVQGPAAAGLVDRAFAGTWPPGLMSMPFSLTGDPGFLCLLPGRAVGGFGLARLLEQAADEGLAVLGDDPPSHLAWQWLRVEAGWPLMGTDLLPRSRVLPQTGLEQFTVSTSKGCYRGQEVVARIRTYGSVPQAMRGVVFSGLDLAALGRLPDPGSPLNDSAGRTLGTWASSGWSTALSAPVALAFLDRDSRTPGQELEIILPDGLLAAAQVQLLPLHNALDGVEQARRLHHQAVQAFGQGQDEQAITLLEEALRLDPTAADAYEALGVILGRAERYPEAIDIFRRLEEVAPDEPMVHTNLSLFYMKIGDREEAERQKALGTMKRFGNLDPDRARQQEDAERESRRQEANRKLDMFAEVLTIDPNDPLALMGMGNALADLDRLEEANTCLIRALAVQRNNSPLYLSRGKVLQRLNRAQEAAAVFRQGINVASLRGDLVPLREMENRLALLQGTSAAS